MPLMANLDQQLKLLKRELKAKDDKIQRLTEHAVMMGNHMDRLKAEVRALVYAVRVLCACCVHAAPVIDGALFCRKIWCRSYSPSF